MPIHASFVDSLEEVANLALGKIGEQASITDIDTDTGSVAETVRRFIYQVIREVQSEFRWGELTKSVLLAIPMAENDDTYQYTMPSDYLRPASNRDQEYVIENGYLFTGEATDFPFKYIRYSEDPAEWSGLMVKCVYFRLALEICMPITENAQKYAALLEEYEKVVFPRACKVGSFDNENPRTRIARGTYGRLRSGIGGAVAAAFNRVIGVIAPGHNHDTDYMPLTGIDLIDTGMIQDASVTADKLSADAKALATDADAIVLQAAQDYADAAEASAVASAVASAASTADSKDAAVRTALLPNIVQGIKTDKQDISAGAFPNWQAISGLSATITPRLASSKLRVRAVINGSHPTTTTDQQMLIRVVRAGSIIALATSKGNRIECHGNIRGYGGGTEIGNCSIEMLLDATATTASVFTVQACMYNAGVVGKINGSVNDTDNSSHYRCVSTLIVEEVFTA